MRIKGKREIVNFFEAFKSFWNQFAPSKPIMLATYSMEIPSGEDCYQYPEVFNDTKMSIRIGEFSTIKLFHDYQKYLRNKKVNK